MYILIDESVEPLGMKRNGKAACGEWKGHVLNPLARYRKTEFSFDRESLCNSISLTCVHVRVRYINHRHDTLHSRGCARTRR